jgi:hypothetical protein
MVDERLLGYVQIATLAYKTALEEIATLAYKTALEECEQTGEDVWPSLNLPEVVLIVSGLIVSGKVISYLEYLKRVRNDINAAPGEDWAKTLLSTVFQDPDPSSDAGNYQPERICLMDVTLKTGNSYLKYNQIIVQLDQVQGWTVGVVSNSD